MTDMRSFPLLLCLLLGAHLSAAEPLHPDPDRVAGYAAGLTDIGDRSPGSPGAQAAADYIEDALRAAGIDRVHRVRTTVTVPIKHEAVLETDIGTIPLYPHVPNNVAPAGTGGETISGRLVIIDDPGRVRDASALTDAIVVLPGDSGDAWHRMAAFGARAIIFRQAHRIDALQIEKQYLGSSIDLPRFVAEISDELHDTEVDLRALVRMEERVAETVLAHIPGSGSDHEDRPPTTVLASGYESGGLIRGLDPGATRAWNAGLLLELARQFAAEPGTRDILVAFHGARAEAFRGLRQSLGTLTDLSHRRATDKEIRWPNAPLADREAVRLTYQLWRSELVGRDLRAFLDLPAEEQTEEALTDLFRDLDHLPEDRDLFAGLNYPPDLDNEVAAEVSSDYTIRLSIGVLLALLAIACLVGSIRAGRPHPVLTTLVVLVVFFVDKELLEPPVTKTETDIDTEEEAVYQLGFRFISEEAGRRADALSRPLESLRLVYSLSKKDEPTAEDRIKIDNNLLIATRLLDREIRTDEIGDLIDDLNERTQAWRDIQQKVTKRELNQEERERLPELVAAVVTPPSQTVPANLDRHIRVLENRRADLMSGIEARRALGIERDRGIDPRFLIDFDFSDGNIAYSSIARGYFVRWENKLRRMHADIREVAERIADQRPDSGLAYDSSPHVSAEPPTSWWPKSYTHTASLANHFLNSVTLSTVNDQRPKLGSPQDTADNFRSQVFLEQTRGLSLFVRRLVDGSLPVAPRHHDIRMRSPEISILTLSQGSATGLKGYPYPLVTVALARSGTQYQRDVQLLERRWGDGFGEARNYYTAHRIPRTWAGANYPLSAVGFHADGRISDVVATAGTQTETGVDNSELPQKSGLRDLNIQLFRAEQSALFESYDPRLLAGLGEIELLSASRDAAPNQSHHEYDRGTAALFAPPGVRLRVIARHGLIGKRLLLLGDHLEETEFLGLAPGSVLASEPVRRDGALTAERRAGPTSLAVARDILQISRERLEILQRNGVSPEDVWTLLAEGQRNLEAGDAALADGEVARADGYGQAAWAYLSRVYPAVLQTANDVVYGLVVMLVLAIPFALICERLFIAANTIFGKIGGFSGFFIATFLFFFFFHPAFELATTPVIIFLAFTIIVTSVLVIAVLYQRFESEMEYLRMAGLGTHKADVSRLGTLLATGTLGISNMRRRPMRTFLTGITVVLMTFILLTFASFSSSPGTRQLSQPVAPNYTGIMLNFPGYKSMGKETAERMRNTWGDRLQFFERSWLMGDGNLTRFPINGPSGSGYVEGVIAVEFGDPSGIEDALVRGDGARGFGGEDDWLFLPPTVLHEIGIEPGDAVFFRGQRLRAGTVDADVLAGITHMGGDPITPLATASLTEDQQKELEKQSEEALTGSAEEPESLNLTHLSPNVVAVTHARHADALNATLSSLAMVPWSATAIAERGADGADLIPANETDVPTLADEMAQQLSHSLQVGARGESYMLTGVGQLAVSGLSDVLIPLILGGLIIFSTMLGSVAERGKEIFIYASLGLAPVHIAALFLVEAGIYAILGGLGGYMLAQFLAAFLGWMATLGIGVQPDLNYSSFTAVVTILMVMGTVLLSSLYPALIASRSAKPGEDTDFSVPEPDGDRMEIPFPFTVAARDVQGLLAFLTTYFDAHTETSTGSFTAAEAAMSVEGDRFLVTAKNWLAPFDLGISQRFAMRAEQTDVKAIYRIHISLELLSGQRNAWRRVLFPFLKDLRKQFLVWRTLDEHTTDRYRAEGGDTEAARRVAEREAADRARRERAQQDKDASAPSEDENGADDAAPKEADDAGDAPDREDRP